MAWLGIEGHDDVVERFRNTLECGRLASSYLFLGPEGCGKRTFAIQLAQTLLCKRSTEEDLDACGECDACRQVQAGTHPDLLIVERPKDRKEIPVKLLIGDVEHRGRQGLCHDISLKPFMGGRRIAVIDDADFLNEEGANCLLKTLEEPPPRSLLILIGTSAERQLPTIRSRCQTIHFRPLPNEIVASLLLEHGDLSDPAEAERLAQFSGGSLTHALSLADKELWQFRSEFLRQLAALPHESVRLARSVTATVEAAGKDNSLRRARATQVANMAVTFYRELLLVLVGANLSEVSGADDVVRQAAEAASKTWTGDEETAARCLERCLETIHHIDRNANLTTLVETWFTDLANLTRGLVQRV